jgi:hypothetical protein
MLSPCMQRQAAWFAMLESILRDTRGKVVKVWSGYSQICVNSYNQEKRT